MAYGSVNVDKMTTSDGISSAGVYGFKNRLINGNFAIDQRNAGASWSATNGAYGLDRWAANSYDGGNTTGKFTIQQNASSVTPAIGFANYLGVTSSAATTYGATGIYTIWQAIEGYNIADLAWGTANAKTITLSFQVYSSLTGTFGGSVQNGGGTRSYPFTYTISSANTWTSISVTIVGDTTTPSTNWNSTNGVGIYVRFGLGVGSTYSGTAGSWASANYYSATGGQSVVGTNTATFYITGTQLEVGSTATSFDYRPYSTELQLCQRYYSTVAAITWTTVPPYQTVQAPVPMRTAPTMATTFSSGTGAVYSNISTTTQSVYQSNAHSSAQNAYITFFAEL